MEKSDKYQVILNAAKRIFAREGYHGSSIARIANEANLGDGTIYLYFKNKEDILINLFNNSIHEGLVPQTEFVLNLYNDPRLMLYELVRSYFSFFGNDFEMAKVIQVEFRQPNENTHEITKKGVKRYFQLISKIIEKGQANEIFRCDVKSSSLKIMIFGTLDEFVTSWVHTESKYSLMTKVEDAYKLILQAISVFPNDKV